MIQIVSFILRLVDIHLYTRDEMALKGVFLIRIQDSRGPVKRRYLY